MHLIDKVDKDSTKNGIIEWLLVLLTFYGLRK